MKPLASLFILLSLLLTLPSSAEVYTWVNEKGVRVYGDEPPADAKKATLPAIQKLKPIKLPDSSKKTADNSTDQFEGYSQLNIISPKDQAIITAGEAGSVTLQVQIQPALQVNHEVLLLLDGKTVQRGAQLQFQIEGIVRGSHLLQVLVKHNGKLLISSAKQRLHVQRPSILNRSRAR